MQTFGEALADYHQLHFDTGLPGKSGDHQAITTVIAGAAQDSDTLQLWPVLTDYRPYRLTRALHQAKAGNTESLDGGAVQHTTLFGRV
ncbi:hypothetical protein GCM10011352_42460 [Marinobacterium zhoushanense]|uniref:Uncharacterized protein n=1 Tax=Marinobacterium zhoushanense TaxID=1679163 RepID=A0ABQ1KV49_9GAMM|nr:hypothetical protein GCM10011352_42460 [Marinobacterium zhoushanense]